MNTYLTLMLWIFANSFAPEGNSTTRTTLSFYHYLHHNISAFFCHTFSIHCKYKTAWLLCVFDFDGVINIYLYEDKKWLIWGHRCVKRLCRSTPPYTATTYAPMTQFVLKKTAYKPCRGNKLSEDFPFFSFPNFILIFVNQYKT